MIEVKKNNSEALKVYDKDETVFTKNGLAALRKAKDVRRSLSADGEYGLTFTLPQDDPNWQYIQFESIVKCDGQLYRIKSVDDLTVSAQAIYKDAAYIFMENVEDMLGKEPRYIMTQLFAGTKIHIMTAKEVSDLGMTWVTDLTDFFETSKLNPIGGLKQLMDTLEKYKIHAELYVDNYNIALVRQIGTDKTNIKISAERNAKAVTPSWDTSQMITKLYAYGKDDLPLGEANNGKNYILSENYEEYPREGFMTFDEIEDTSELLAAAQAQFSPENIDRIDQPNFTFNVQFLDTGNENIGLGDTVTVVDINTRKEYQQRIVSMECYPFERERNTITTGKMPTSINDVLTDLVGNYRQTQIQTNEKGELKTGWLEMMQENKKVTINQQLQNQEIALYKTGALFEAPDGSCAVAIIQGQLAIAAGKTDGSWDWTTVIDDNEIIVSEVFTGTLYTETVKLMGEGAKLTIDNNLITMKDEDSDVVRLKLGYDNDSEQYLFEMRDADGNRTMYLDDDGNLTLTGVFKTGETGARIVIDGNGIQSYDDNGQKSGLFSEPVGANTPLLELYLDNEPLFTIRGMNVDVPGIGTVLQCNIIGPNNTTILGVLGTTINPQGRWNFQDGDLTVNNKRVLTEDDLQNIT